jgi:hypothetical protein
MHSRNAPLTALAVCVTLVLTGVASAAPLVSFNMNDVPQDTPLPSYVTTADGDANDFGTVATGVKDVTVSLGDGMTRATYNNTFGARKASGSPDYASLSEAQGAGGSFVWTVQPEAGQQITYSDAYLNTSYQNAGAEAVKGIALMASIGADAPIELLNADFDYLYKEYSPSLAALGTTDKAVTFELYFWNPNSGSSGYDQRGIGRSYSAWQNQDDLVINGTVSEIPEPASMLLLSTGAVAAMIRRRRR